MIRPPCGILVGFPLLALNWAMRPNKRDDEKHRVPSCAPGPTSGETAIGHVASELLDYQADAEESQKVAIRHADEQLNSQAICPALFIVAASLGGIVEVQEKAAGHGAVSYADILKQGINLDVADESGTCEAHMCIGHDTDVEHLCAHGGSSSLGEAVGSLALDSAPSTLEALPAKLLLGAPVQNPSTLTCSGR
ncbi:hypothetical protein Nepgr_029972 [Nepenthes gracilis]|uniref:Uncharacterized protein n=1 Tax=Nepenthes gracilis TaxID=150966 RepID=A0AAD3TFE0_NEPGR|nr:hypothetical protein Nepgr_029972 [Nepenthes gracilis]